MSIDSPSIPPEGEPQKKNTLLWGCLIALVLALVIFCCAGSMLFLPLFTDFDPLGTNLRDRIEEVIPLDYLEDPSSIPGMEEYLDELEDIGAEPTQDFPSFVEESLDAQSLPLSTCYFNDIGVSFSYPSGWEIEVENYTITFYDPDSYTYLYMGEYLVDPGSTAEEVTNDVLENVQEDAQEGSYELLSGTRYTVPIPYDAYLTLFEWIDQDGYYTWAYDLEMVSGESNIFFFLSGEDPNEIEMYGELLDIIASSLSRFTTLESEGDA